MDAIDLLKAQAVAKRYAAILKAKREYQRELTNDDSNHKSKQPVSTANFRANPHSALTHSSTS
jgi:hypothetical protein